MNFYPELARRCDANLGCTLDFGRSAMISMEHPSSVVQKNIWKFEFWVGIIRSSEVLFDGGQTNEVAL